MRANLSHRTGKRIFLLFLLILLLTGAVSCISEEEFKKFFPPGSGNTYSCACICDMISDAPISYGEYRGTVVIPHDHVFRCSNDANVEFDCKEGCKTYATLNNERLGYPESSPRECRLSDPFTGYKCVKTGVCSNSMELSLQAGLPPHTTIEGPVDFGVSYVDIKVSDVDEARVNLKGKIAVTGGNCPGQECPIEFWYVMVESEPEAITTKKGHTISDLVVLNQNIWSGTKYADESFVLNPESLLGLSVTRDERHGLLTMYPRGFEGKFGFNVGRRKNPNEGLISNYLTVDGDFVKGSTQVHLHLQAWLTNCQPKVEAGATCGGIDYEPALNLYSNFGLLGNLQNQDLCNAMLASDTTQVCSAWGDTEFPIFGCTEKSLPLPSETSEVAKHLSFHWRDALGNEISNEPYAWLEYTPPFPITLSVENEWGRAVTATIQQAPAAGACPAKVLYANLPNGWDIPPGSVGKYATSLLPQGSYTFRLSGPDDAELRVRVGKPPTEGVYDCRAEAGVGDKSCTVEVREPDSAQLMITGEGKPLSGGITFQWNGISVTDIVKAKEERHYQTPILPKGVYSFETRGNGDADLYVRVGQAPTTELFDCRPFLTNSNEGCQVELDEDKDIFIMVRGWADTSEYELTGLPQ